MAIIAPAMQGPAPKAPVMPPPGMPPGQQGMGQQDMKDEPATEEEQSYYDRAMLAVGRILYEKNAIKDFVATIKGSPNPAEAIARSTLDIVKGVDQKSGGQIPETMLVPIATDTLAMLIEGAQAAGTKIDGQVVAQATQSLIQQFMSENGADPREIQQLSSMIDTQGIGNEISKVMAEPETPEETAAEPGEEPGEMA